MHNEQWEVEQSEPEGPTGYYANLPRHSFYTDSTTDLEAGMSASALAVNERHMVVRVSLTVNLSN